MTLDVVPANLFRKAADDVGPLLAAQRMVKDEQEVEALRLAAGMFDAAHDEAVVRHLALGVTEVELAAEVVAALRRAGHDGMVFYRRYQSRRNLLRKAAERPAP